MNDLPASPIRAHRQLAAIWATPPGLGRLTAVNHTIVGKRFLATAFLFLIIGGLLAMLMRAQLATSDSAFVGHDAYHQIFTMHGTVMMFLFAIPMIEGLALYLLPKMLGARDLAFPRLSAFGYYCFLFGGLIILVSFVLGVAPDSGWFMYTPLSSRPFTPGINADVWLIGVTFVEISALAIGVELIVTIFTIRAAGMSLNRMPLFAWYMLVTAFMILFAFPPLVLASVLLEIERAFGWPLFNAQGGGSPLLWQHLFWLFGHPDVYIIFLPGAAIITAIIPALAQRPIVGYTWIVGAVLATGFISFMLWVHHMYAVGIPPVALAFFSAASMLVAIPTGIQVFAWIATLWAGRPVVRLPMIYFFGFLVTFIAGGLTGVMVALVPFDWQVHDTHFVVAHMHYVLVGGFVFPLLAGAYYWMPHITGRMPSETLGRWAFWLIFIGFNLTFFVMHLTGLLGMPRRVYTYAPDLGWDLPNLVSSVGGFIMAAGFAVFLLDVFLHTRLGRLAPRNPWKAGTLEWAMSTPPPAYNFASLPPVDALEPLWERPQLAAESAGCRHYLGIPRNGWQETLGVNMVSGVPTHFIILPRPSWLPFTAGCAMAVFFSAFLLRFYLVAAAGALAALVLFLIWAWENGFKTDPQPMPAGHGLNLPPHTIVAGAPGYLGMVFSLLANASLFLHLLFAYFYLWTVAPNWPPPAFLVTTPLVPLGLLLAVGTAYVAALRAGALNARSGPADLAPWLVTIIVAGLLAAITFLAPAFTGGLTPTTHAYDAIVTILLGYAAVHCGLGAIMAAYVWLRIRAGYVSPARSLDVRNLLLWWAYASGISILVIASVYGSPWLWD